MLAVRVRGKHSKTAGAVFVRPKKMRSEPWDWPPEPQRQRRRPPPVLEGEILTPEEPTPSPIHRVEVTVHRRQHQHV
jgi:hypothetical protein